MQRATIAVLGHNEEEYLRGTLLALQPIGPEVWFVDSGSTDSSRDIALGMGARVLEAPRGKGAAFAEALGQIPYRQWLLFLDGDAGSQSAAIARAMLPALSDGKGMLLGQFQSYSLLPVTQGIYTPLLEELFPEIGDRYGTRPLSGFRALSRGFSLEPPPDFGVEAYLNISVALQGGQSQIIDVGRFRNPFRAKPEMPRQIAKAILDLAAREGRITAAARADWEIWVEKLVIILEDGASQGYGHLRRQLATFIAERPWPKQDSLDADQRST